MILALLNQKGGVGKTTLAVHLAGEIVRSHRSVMVVDADPQGSALDWSESRRRAGYHRLFGVVGIPRETLHQEIRALTGIVDHLIIDGPPRVTSLTSSAIMAADCVLIPVQPSPYDVWACTEIVTLVREAMIFKPTLRSAFVINRKIVRTVIGREVSIALERFGLPVLRSTISQRIAFAESAINGSLVQDLHPKGPAQWEVQLLLSELLGEGRQ